MSSHAKQLLEEALHLTEEERGDFAACLLESLDPAADDDRDAAWSAEIEHRLEELRTGQVKPVPWTEAREMITQDGDDPASA